MPKLKAMDKTVILVCLGLLSMEIMYICVVLFGRGDKVSYIISIIYLHLANIIILKDYKKWRKEYT